jgi:hypothetical protein
MATRYHVILIKGPDETHYRIYDQKHRRYFRRAFRTQKDAAFFIDILNKADRKTTEALPDAEEETTEKKDDND